MGLVNKDLLLDYLAKSDFFVLLVFKYDSFRNKRFDEMRNVLKCISGYMYMD